MRGEGVGGMGTIPRSIWHLDIVGPVLLLEKGQMLASMFLITKGAIAYTASVLSTWL